MRAGDRKTMRELLTRTDDPRVHARVWDFIEGKISKQELYRDPGFAREMSAWYAEAAAQARERGLDPEQVRAAVAEAEAEMEPILATPEGIAAALEKLRAEVAEAEGHQGR